jgi:hypothetical protein
MKPFICDHGLEQDAAKTLNYSITLPCYIQAYFGYYQTDLGCTDGAIDCVITWHSSYKIYSLICFNKTNKFVWKHLVIALYYTIVMACHYNDSSWYSLSWNYKYHFIGKEGEIIY